MPSTPPSNEELAQRLSDHFMKGGTFGDLAGFDDKDYEAIYAIGHGLYGQQRYEDALMMFGFLVANNPFDRRFHQAMGAALQVLGRYDEAIGYYSMASIMNMKDPIPTFHTAECLAAKGDLGEAQKALEIVIEQCTGPDHQPLKSRAQAFQALILRKIEGA